MSIPRNIVPPPPSHATPGGVPGAHRRRAVMVGNLLASSGLFFFAACSDTTPTAPAPAPAAARREPSAAPAPSGPSRMLSSATTGDTTRFSFVISPTSAFNASVEHDDVVLGTVHVPAGAVCDPATSGYGPTLWEQRCETIKTSLTFQGKTWRDAAGNPRVVLSPDVRFVPTAVAMISLRAPVPLAAGATVPPILWCRTGTTTCVDESTTDKAVVTRYDAASQMVYRRIKHFSGYNTGFGRVGTSLTDGGL